MGDFHGFLVKSDREAIEDQSQLDANKKREIRTRSALALRDLEIVANTLDGGDFGDIVRRWVQMENVGWYSGELQRGTQDQMVDVLGLLWSGLNVNMHLGHDPSDENFVRWLGRREDTVDDLSEVGKDDMVPGYSNVDWENWLERSIRSSEPTAHVNVSIDVYTDDGLDAIENEYRNGEGVRPAEYRSLVDSGRITLDEYNELGGSGAVELIKEPGN